MSRHTLLFCNLLLIGIDSSSDCAAAGSAAGSAGDFVARGFAAGGLAADRSVAGGLQQMAL